MAPVIPRWVRPGLAGLRPHTPPLLCKVVLGVRDDKELAKAVKRLEDNGLPPPSLVVNCSMPTPLSYQRSRSSTLTRKNNNLLKQATLSLALSIYLRSLT